MYDLAVLGAWIEFAARWTHVITAIAWIGSSFYFVALDLGLRFLAQRLQQLAQLLRDPRPDLQAGLGDRRHRRPDFLQLAAHGQGLGAEDEVVQLVGVPVADDDPDGLPLVARERLELRHAEPEAEPLHRHAADQIAEVAVRGANQEREQVVQTVLRRIREHISDASLTPVTLAETAGYSRRRLDQMFLAQLGQPVSACITWVSCSFA